MSNRSFTVDGFGISLNNLEINKCKMAAFLRKYFPDKFEEFDIKPNATDEEIVFAFDYSYESGCGDLSVWAAVADAISENEGIIVEYFDGEYEKAIILPACMPWQYNEKERVLTLNDFERIFAVYFEELGYPKIEVDSQSIEFYC